MARKSVVGDANAALNDHNRQVEQKFRRYYPAPELDASAAVSPTVKPWFSNASEKTYKYLGTQKAEQSKPEKKSWFQRLFGKKAQEPKVPWLTEADASDPEVVAKVIAACEANIYPKAPTKPKEKNLPNWAKVALMKASRVDDVMLRQAKAEARAQGNSVFSTPPESNSSNQGPTPKVDHKALPIAAPQATAVPAANVDATLAVWHTPEKRGFLGTAKAAASTAWGKIKGWLGK